MKEKAKEKNYRVWFDQINQTTIDVKAKNAKQAIERASRIWKRDSRPSLGDIKEIS